MAVITNTRLTSSGIVCLDFTGNRLTSGGIVKGIATETGIIPIAVDDAFTIEYTETLIGNVLDDNGNGVDTYVCV